MQQTSNAGENQNPRTASIPSSWIAMTGVLDAKVLLKLHAKVTELGVDVNDTEAVRQVWEGMRG